MALKTARTKRARNKRSKQRRGAAGRPRLAGAHAPGATALTTDDLVGLKLPATTHGELNALEAENILHGWRWAVRSTTSRVPNMLTEAYPRELHRRMFGEVWSWAGENRTREVNVGVDPSQISARLRVVLDDAQFWVSNGTFGPEELAIRLHHRVVQVHPFRNRNGRHARLLADLLLVKHFKRGRLPWGGDTLDHRGHRRDEYIAAVRSADTQDYLSLLKLCPSSV